MLKISKIKFIKYFILCIIISLFIHVILLLIIFFNFNNYSICNKKYQSIMEVSLQNSKILSTNKSTNTNFGAKANLKKDLAIEKINEMIKNPLKSMNINHNDILSAHEDTKPIDIDQQNINAWQWQQHSFFYRLKKRIAQNWHPRKQIQAFDPQGNLLGVKDRITLMRIVIDQKGNIIEAYITKSSDVAYLDQEAMTAIKLAQPFINPPKELFIKSSLFSFDFGFFVYVNNQMLDFL